MAASSQVFGELSQKVLDWPIDQVPKGNVQFLWKRMLDGIGNELNVG
jgi:hypothetical protein